MKCGASLVPWEEPAIVPRSVQRLILGLLDAAESPRRGANVRQHWPEFATRRCYLAAPGGCKAERVSGSIELACCFKRSSTLAILGSSVEGGPFST